MIEGRNPGTHPCIVQVSREVTTPFPNQRPGVRWGRAALGGRALPPSGEERSPRRGRGRWWCGHEAPGGPARGGSARRRAEDFSAGTGRGEGRLRQGEEPLPASRCLGSLPSQLRYKTGAGMIAAHPEAS